MKNTEYFSNFYVVEDPLSKRKFRGQIANDNSDSGKLLRGEFDIEILEIEYLEGQSEPETLFWNRLLEPFCVNQDLIELFKQNQLKGWNAIPATVKNKFGNYVDSKYFALAVNGRADPIDYLLTDITFKQMPGGKFPYFKGLYFEPESWDGSDIFMSRTDINGKATAFVFVTRKIVTTFDKYRIRNIDFINFNEYLTECDIVKDGATESMKKSIDNMISKACA